MDMIKLRTILEDEYQDLEAELTNIPESDEELKIEISAWMDAIIWILDLLDNEDISKHANEILQREGAEEIGQ